MRAKGGIVLVGLVAAHSHEQACKPFKEIYSDGKDLCETMWGDAFAYEPDESAAYTMWFFGANPNDAVTARLGGQTPDECHLDYLHKDAPGPEGPGFTECHPWRDRACCAEGTVASYQTIKEAYGAEYHWDRCGPLSQECERFFVQEGCFYECEPSVGLFRRFPVAGDSSQHVEAAPYDPRCDSYAPEYDAEFASSSSCAHNTWEVYKMPIKASYCDAWYAACAEDLFCAADGGNFFTCAKIYEEADAAQLAQQLEEESVKRTMAETKREEAEDLRDAAKASETTARSSAIAAGVLLAASVAIFAVTVWRERAGKPLFARLDANGEATTDKADRA